MTEARDTKMYGPLAGWFHLLTAPHEYADEARTITAVAEEFAQRELRTMLELGCGGGNNASHLKARFAMTLTDLSPDMLELSRSINPECEHVAGDMRTLRLGRRFDAVLMHDAVVYLLSVEDVLAALRTAAEHLEPGGVVVVCPDDTFESFQATTECGGHDGEVRSMRYLQWVHPLDTDGIRYRVTYVYVLRDADGTTRVEHEDHDVATFPRAAWLDAIEQAGLHASVTDWSHYVEESSGRDIFVGVKALE